MLFRNTHGKRLNFLLSLIISLILLLQISQISAWALDGTEEVPYENSKEKSILILQSYHRGHEWSDGQGNAIIETLVKSDIRAAISLEYMDWKRYPDEKNLELLYDRLSYKYAKIKIDLIMATDDAAVKFALDHRDDLFSGAPVVFSGVLREDADILLQGYRNITGVYQVMDPGGTLKSAVSMIPDLNKVYLVHDMSESGISTGEMIKNEVYKNYRTLRVIELSGSSLEQLLSTVQNLDRHSIILLASYNSDINHVVLPIQELSNIVSKRSSVPVFTIDEGILGYGSIGGSLTDASEHGKMAAEIGIRILNGEAADSIPISDKKSEYWGFDYQQMERFGIPLEKLPAESKVINKPFSFYETYKTFVLSNIAIIIILFLFIIYLLINIKYRKQIENTLKSQKEAIYKLAYYNSVTGLPNRNNLKETLERIITGEASKTEGFSIIYMDVDNFKEVNDTFGHIVGDRILHSLAQRLCESGKFRDDIYTLGGDEFIILIRNNDAGRVEDIVEILMDSISKPFFSDDNTFYLTVSGGIVSYPDHGDNYTELLKNADTAMYRSKESGKGTFTYFDQYMSDEAVKKTKMQSQLRTAIEHGDFLLYYQPQMEARTGRIWGYEALIRWNSPEFGFVQPLSFIKIAEESRLIIPIGDWVLENACRFIKSVQEKYCIDCSVSVNISVIQLLQGNFVEKVLRVLEQTGLKSSFLELEITESIFLNSPKLAIEKLEKLKKAGISIALDDFGTGYSSLSYVSQLPITTLKIDQSFIKSVNESKKNMVLTNTIIKMGHDMGLELVVEGVETVSQKELVTDLGCDRIQGYEVGMPVPEYEIFSGLDRNDIKGTV